MSSLKCQRFTPPEGLCELTEANLLWKNSRQWYLSDIQLIKAINQKRQLRLQTAKGEIRLMPYYSSLGRTAITHQQLRVREMTRFFTDPQRLVLDIREDSRVVNIPFGLAFLLLGLAGFWQAQGFLKADTSRLAKDPRGDRKDAPDL